MILGLAAAVKALLLGAFLVVPDLVWDYPFAGGDGLEWLVSGLWLRGADVACFGRQPLWPAVLAAFDLAGLLRWAPLANQLIAAALVLAVYRMVRRRYRAAVALACGAFVLAAHALTLMSLELMADLLAVLLITLAFDGRLLAGAAGGLAQSAAPLLLAPLLARIPGRRLLALGALLLPLAGWQIAMRLAGCSPLVPRAQADSLGIHLDAIDDYASMTLSFIGWPALALGVLGAAVALRSASGRQRLRPAALYLATFVALFVVVYGFRSLRFVAYALPGLVLLLAEGFSRLAARRTAFAAALAAVLLGAAWPQAGLFDVRWMVWPVPAVEVSVALDELAAAPPPLALMIGRPAFGDLAGRWAPARVLARPALGASEPHLERPAEAAAAAVLLAPPSWSAAERHESKLRWMATLRRRVRAAPRDLYPLGGSVWASLPPGEPTAEARVVGAAVQAALDGDDGLLAVARAGSDEEDDALWRWLPFVVRTTNLFFLTPEEARALPREPGMPALAFGPFRAARARFRGRPVLLLDLDLAR